MIHAGRYRDTYFLLDVEGGSLHAVDPLAYEIGRRLEKGLDEEEILNELEGAYQREDVQDAIKELRELEAEGLLGTPAATEQQMAVYEASTHPVIKSLCLHIAHDCNLRCSYCFADEGTYRGERGLMTKEVARAALDFLVEQSQGRKHLEVDFFGGEPLINFAVVQDAVAYGRELEKKYGKIIRFTLTTNAYHVTDEMIDFINREMKNLVISIDGRQEVHDAQRKNAAGQGSYEKVVKNAKRLLQDRGQKEYYVRGTYTAANLDFSKDVEALADLGFDEISLEPVVTKEEKIALKKTHLPQIQEEYERLAELLEKRRQEGRPFHFFHFLVDFTSGPCLNKRVRGCGAGTEYAAISPKGDIYPCHQFVGQKEFCMGNVLEDNFDLTVGKPFLATSVLHKPDCQTCFAKYFCSGGCAASAYQMSGSLTGRHEVSCDIQKMRLDIAIGLYIRKLEEQRREEKGREA